MFLDISQKLGRTAEVAQADLQLVKEETAELKACQEQLLARSLPAFQTMDIPSAFVLVFLISLFTGDWRRRRRRRRRRGEEEEEEEEEKGQEVKRKVNPEERLYLVMLTPIPCSILILTRARARTTRPHSAVRRSAADYFCMGKVHTFL